MSVPLIRTSERSDFKHCQFYWWHHWQNGLTTPRVPTWAWFGTAIHKAQEVRYPIGHKRGKPLDVLNAFEAAVGDETRKVYEKGGELDDDEVHDGRELGLAMLRGYMKHWGEDKHWEVLHTEQPFQIDVRHPRSGRLIAVYLGTWDLAIWDNVDKVFRIVDHKTRAQFLRSWVHFEINDQAGSYLWVAPEVLQHMGLLGPKDDIDGIVFNMLRKAMPQPVADDGIRYNQPKKKHYQEALAPIMNLTGKEGMVTLDKLAKLHKLVVKGDARAVQPVPNFERYITRRKPEQRVKQGLKVIDEALHMEAIRKGKLPLLKNTGEHCARCPLFDFCLLDEEDKDGAQEYAATMLVKRDVYADHREAMQDNGFIISGS
jgi:hypothetical protein